MLRILTKMPIEDVKDPQENTDDILIHCERDHLTLPCTLLLVLGTMF